MLNLHADKEKKGVVGNKPLNIRPDKTFSQTYLKLQQFRFKCGFPPIVSVCNECHCPLDINGGNFMESGSNGLVNASRCFRQLHSNDSEGGKG